MNQYVYKSMIRIIISTTLCLFLFHLNTMIFDFNKNADISVWKIVDDRVMGGISQGRFSLTDEGYGKFHGLVTTESNGGFSSVDYNFNTLEVGSKDKLKVRLKGDGKIYQLRVKAFSSDRHNYIKEISTSGDWETFEIPLAYMYPSWRGNKLNIPNFDKDQITSITILIANGKRENFEILLDSIELIKS